jgi:hypothetical protein
MVPCSTVDPLLADADVDPPPLKVPDATPDSLHPLVAPLVVPPEEMDPLPAARVPDVALAPLSRPPHAAWAKKIALSVTRHVRGDAILGTQ